METEKRKAAGRKRTGAQILNDALKLHKLYDHCMENADDLITEAKILRDHKRFARALFLAHTALEEIAKAQVVADYAEDCVSREELDMAFRSHSMKSAYLERKVELRLGSDRQTNATIRYDLKRGKHMAEWREQALYVSFVLDFDSFWPEHQITEKQCESMIREAEEYIQYLREMAAITGRLGIKSLTK